MVRCFDRLSITTNGINNLPFVLSLSKDLFSVSLSQPVFNQSTLVPDCLATSAHLTASAL